MVARKQSSENSQRKITIIFGYSLFVAALATLTVATVIPGSMLLLNPAIKHVNVIAILLSFIAAAIVPFLVAYIIGDKITRIKSKVAHHYNGVLFGVLAYWLSFFFNSIGSLTIMSVREAIPEIWISTIVNSWPILATILVITIIAVGYHARPQKAQGSVLQYKPYQLLLLSSVIAVLFLTPQFVAGGYQPTSLLFAVIYAVFIGISYGVLRKAYPLKPVRLSGAIVAFSFSIISMGLAGQLASYAGYNTMTPITIIFTVVGVAVWALYLGLVVRARRGVK